MVALLALIAGAALAPLLLYSSLKIRFEAELQERLRQSTKQAADEAVRRSGATVKGQLGERFAPFVPGFGYEPGDARFLGSPVDYVVFDGLTSGQIRAVAFVEVKTGAAWLTRFQQQVREAIKQRRVEWRVVELPG